MGTFKPIAHLISHPSTAGPDRALFGGASLIRLGRIYAMQPDILPRNDNRIAIDDLDRPLWRRLCNNRKKQLLPMEWEAFLQSLQTDPCC